MKNTYALIFVSTTLATSMLFANTNNILKESFLPAEGTFYFESTYNLSKLDSKLKGPAGTVADTKSTISTLQLGLGYGISDLFVIGAKAAYVGSQNIESTFGVGSTKNGTTENYKSSGLIDPEFIAMYRVGDYQKKRAKIHLLVGLSPKIQNAKSSTATSNGNVANGNNRLRVGVTFYKEVKNTEFYITAQRAYNSLSSSENAADSTKTTEDDEHQSTGFKFGFLNSFSDDLSLGSELIFSVAEGYDSKSHTNTQLTSKVSYDSQNYTGVAFQGKYKLTDESFVSARLEKLINAELSFSSGGTKLSSTDFNGIYITMAYTTTFE